jgi:hypothetical protein
VLTRHRDVPIIIEMKLDSEEMGQRVAEAHPCGGRRASVCAAGYGSTSAATLRRLLPHVATSACTAEVRLAVYRSWGGWPVKRPPFGGYQVPEHAGRIRIARRASSGTRTPPASRCRCGPWNRTGHGAAAGVGRRRPHQQSPRSCAWTVRDAFAGGACPIDSRNMITAHRWCASQGDFRMRRILTIATAAMIAVAGTVLVAQKVTNPAELDAAMKKIGPAQGAAGKAIQASDFATAKAQVAIVKQTLTDAENFWVTNKKDDAIRLQQGFDREGDGRGAGAVGARARISRPCSPRSRPWAAPAAPATRPTACRTRTCSTS